MAKPSSFRLAEIKGLIMRFAPVAAALSLFLATTASVTTAGERNPEPLAATLIAQGHAALEAGDTQAAIDSYEAALAVDPAHTPILIYLAEAARSDSLQGKAIVYYREALERDPGNFTAIAGEGAAMVERGAIEQAERNLARLESLCGTDCPETVALQASIAAGPPERLAADASEDGAVSN